MSQFETRYIIFIEDGTDLKNDCRCFPEVKRQPDEVLSGAVSVAAAEAEEIEEKGLASIRNTTSFNAGWHPQRLAGVALSESMPSKRRNINTVSQSVKGDNRDLRTWNHQEREVKIDIIRYMAKYDFDVARKICPLKGGVQYTECQEWFT